MDNGSIAFVAARSQTGSAFRIAPHLLITSLHVVRDLSEVHLQFPRPDGFLGESTRAASVAQVLPSLDVAVLRLPQDSEPLPPGPLIAPLSDVRGHHFKSLGYPQAAGRCLTELTGRLRIRRPVELHGHVIPAFQIDPDNQRIAPEGFSGAPVYVPFFGGTIGVFGGYYPDAGIHFAVPIVEVLRHLSSDDLPSLDSQVLPHLAQTGVSRAYSESTFCPTVDCEGWTRALESSEPAVVRLVGPSGIGKSCHASSWAQHARENGSSVLWGDLARDGGLGRQGNVSTVEFLFDALTPTPAAAPDVDADTVLRQIRSVIEEQATIRGTRSRLVFVTDGLDALKDRAAFWKTIFRDLQRLDALGLPVVVLCCERSEFSEVEPIVIPGDQSVSVHDEVLAPLPREKVIHVYQDGYRRLAYPWLPPADELPPELLDLCSIPIFIHYLVQTIMRLQKDEPVYAGDVLRSAISQIVEQSCEDLLDPGSGRLVRDSLREVIAGTVKLVSRKAGLAHPPQREVAVRDIIAEVSRLLEDAGLDPALARPHDVLSTLSRTGFLDLHGPYAAISSDVLYEFQIARLYAELAGQEDDGHPVDATRLQDIVHGIHGQSLDRVTPKALDDMVDRLLTLPPCRETFALRFIEYAIEPPADRFVLQFGFDLRLLQVVREYCSEDHRSDLDFDDTLYREVQEHLPTVIPEAVLAFPPLAEEGPDDEGPDQSGVACIPGGRPYRFADFSSWVRMRRALFLLLVMGERRLTTVQHLAGSLRVQQLDDYSKRIALLANSILSKNPRSAVLAYRLGQVDDVTQLLSIIPYFLSKDPTSMEPWPSWLHWVADRILADIPSHFEVEENKVKAGPLYFYLSALREMPEKAVKILGENLRSKDHQVRTACLRFCELLVNMREQILPEETVRGLREARIPATIGVAFAPLLRWELSLHAERPSSVDEERHLAAAVAARLWDGSEPADALPEDPETRPYAIGCTVEKCIVVDGRTTREVVQLLREQILAIEYPEQQALDAIAACLAVVSRFPSEWNAAWESLKDLVLQVDAIGAMADLLDLVGQTEESCPGERYEAINLLLLPLDDETAFPEDVRRRAMHVERWAKSQLRFPGEEKLMKLVRAARDLLQRKEYDAAAQCGRVLKEDAVGPIMQMRARLFLVHAERGLEDEAGTLAAIKDLEDYADAVEEQDLDVLVQPDVLGPFREKIAKAQAAQIRSLVWPAREVRAEIHRKAGRLKDALTDLETTRQEALGLGAWWPAFRGLERECEIHCLLGNPAAAMVAAQELEDASDHPVPRTLGKMQRAVLLREEATRKRDRESFEEAVSLLDEVLSSIAVLEGGLPNREIEGIRLWLGSTRVRCLCDLERHDEAIAGAGEIVSDARRIESEVDVANAMALLEQCQEDAGRVQDAIETAQARFAYCTRTGAPLEEHAGDAAIDVSDLLLKTARESSSKEAAELAIHWLGQAAKIFDNLKNSDRSQDVQQRAAAVESEFVL